MSTDTDAKAARAAARAANPGRQRFLGRPKPPRPEPERLEPSRDERELAAVLYLERALLTADGTTWDAATKQQRKSARDAIDALSDPDSSDDPVAYRYLRIACTWTRRHARLLSAHGSARKTARR